MTANTRINPDEWRDRLVELAADADRDGQLFIGQGCLAILRSLNAPPRKQMALARLFHDLAELVE